jgi:hypothetical protein
MKIEIPGRADLKVIRPSVLVLSYVGLNTVAPKRDFWKSTDGAFYVQDFDFDARVNATAVGNNQTAGMSLAREPYAGATPGTPDIFPNQLPFANQFDLTLERGDGQVLFNLPVNGLTLLSRPGRKSLLSGVVLDRNEELRCQVHPQFTNGTVDLRLYLLGFLLQT